MDVKVQILSRKIIEPSIPTPNHLRTHKLCFFDQLQTPALIPLVFFYSSCGIDKVSNNGNKIERLEKSLSETLTRFYPLAGRLGEDGISIDCNDQGAEFSEAQVNCRLAEFLGEEPLNIDLLREFVPRTTQAANSITTPLVMVQANIFECGGLAVTVQVSHVVGDGFSGCTFIHEWATASRLGINEVISPSFDLASLFPPRDRSWMKPAPPIKCPDTKIVAKSFWFDGATISTIRAKLMASGLAHIEKQPSRIELVTALIWKALINISCAKHGKLRSSFMPVPLNLRGRTPLAVPENSFGNFYLVVLVKFLAAEKNGPELHDLVRLLGDTMRNTVAQFQKAADCDNVCSMVVDLLNPKPEDEPIDFCMFTTLCRFPLYGVDFGWGKPSWISVVSLHPEQFSLLDTECRTGIEVQVQLNEADMALFENDPDIMSSSSLSK